MKTKFTKILTALVMLLSFAGFGFSQNLVLTPTLNEGDLTQTESNYTATVAATGITLTLESNVTENVKIYYTTDKQAPTNASTVYSDPISVTFAENATEFVVKAKAIKETATEPSSKASETESDVITVTLTKKAEAQPLDLKIIAYVQTGMTMDTIKEPAAGKNNFLIKKVRPGSMFKMTCEGADSILYTRDDAGQPDKKFPGYLFLSESQFTNGVYIVKAQAYKGGAAATEVMTYIIYKYVEPKPIVVGGVIMDETGESETGFVDWFKNGNPKFEEAMMASASGDESGIFVAKNVTTANVMLSANGNEDDSDIEIYYTTGNEDPTRESTLSDGNLMVDMNGKNSLVYRLKAYEKLDGKYIDSSSKCSVMTFFGPDTAFAPTFNVPSGSGLWAGDTLVVLFNSLDADSIFVATGDTKETAKDFVKFVKNDTIVFAGDTVVRAYSMKNGHYSDTVMAEYVLNLRAEFAVKPALNLMKYSMMGDFELIPVELAKEENTYSATVKIDQMKPAVLAFAVDPQTEGAVIRYEVPGKDGITAEPDKESEIYDPEGEMAQYMGGISLVDLIPTDENWNYILDNPVVIKALAVKDNAWSETVTVSVTFEEYPKPTAPAIVPMVKYYDAEEEWWDQYEYAKDGSPEQFGGDATGVFEVENVVAEGAKIMLDDNFQLADTVYYTTDNTTPTRESRFLLISDFNASINVEFAEGSDIFVLKTLAYAEAQDEEEGGFKKAKAEEAEPVVDFSYMTLTCKKAAEAGNKGEVEDLAALNALYETFEPAQVYTVKGEVTITAMDGRSIWVQDKACEKAAGHSMLLYGVNPAGAQVGSVLKGVRGNLKNYNGLLEMEKVVADSLKLTGATAAVKIDTVTIAQIKGDETMRYQNAMMCIENVEFDCDTIFAAGKNYDLIQGTDTLAFRANAKADYIGEKIPSGKGTVVVYGGYYNAYQVSPRNKADLMFTPAVVERDTVKAPTFSVAAGAVKEGTKVELKSATTGAKIYYTVNGDDPTASSTEYKEAIVINKAMTIKAIAIMEGMVDSKISEAKYTIKEVANEGKELAGVSVYPNPNNGEFYVTVPVNATVEVFGVNGKQVAAMTVGAGKNAVKLNNAGIYFVRVRANGQDAIRKVVVR